MTRTSRCAVAVSLLFAARAGAQPCPDWSPKFDRVDDPETLAALKANKAQGWDAAAQREIAQGSSLATQIAGARRRLAHLKSLPGADKKRQSQILAIDGMLDLLQCRTKTIAGGGVAHHPPAPGRVVAQVGLRVLAAAPTRAVKVPFLEVGPEKDKTVVEVPIGGYVLLRSSPTMTATGFVVAPAQGVMEAPSGRYHFPKGVFGILKAVGQGNVNVTLIGPAAAHGVNAGNPSGGTSPNWSGYAQNGGPFTAIRGQWTVPTVSPSGVSSGDIDKPSYGRGAGVAPTLCPAGQQYDAGLCYQNCREGFHGIGPVCWGTCPSGYHDDGATCRKDAEIIGKHSYGRGVGTVPTDCGPGRQLDAGLCYNNCNAGYSGVGPVCWQQCRAGYHDDGATCRRDAQIIGADNSHCPWYDTCGLVTARGCSTCPAGFHNDGCTCRIDVDIYGKSSYGRGGGTVPNQCPGGRQYDAGLCYAPCNAGDSGVGPVCWSPCPAGFHDDGATCRKDVSIVGKPSYGRGVGAVPTDCGAGRQLDAGLCYNDCNAGYNGIGPVCWGSCPLGYLDQGAICYKPTQVESSTWIGIDGNANSSLIQVGTDQNFDSGFLGIGRGTNYGAWWEILPAASTPINQPVKPGDVIVATIVPATGTTPQPNVASNWVITITNQTRNWTFNTTQSYSAPLSSAEWIQEATSECNPAGCAIMQLASCSNVVFDTSDTINASVNPNLQASQSINMSQNGTVVSTPSNPDADTDGFTVTFGQTVPAAPAGP